MARERADELFKPATTIPFDQAAAEAAYTKLETANNNLLQGLPAFVDVGEVVEGVITLDRMGQTSLLRIKRALHAMGRDNFMQAVLQDEVFRASAAGEDERVMQALRVLAVMGTFEEQNLGTWLRGAILRQRTPAIERRETLSPLYNQHKQELERKQAAAAAAAAPPPPPPPPPPGTSPTTGPATAPSTPGPTVWPPEQPSGNPEWDQAKEEAKQKWEDRLATTNLAGMGRKTREHTRFSLAMDILHEAILQSQIVDAKKVWAMTEYLITQIVDTPEEFNNFIQVSRAEADRWPEADSIATLHKFVKALYIPANLKTLTTRLTRPQEGKVRAIYRHSMKVYHPNNITNFPEANPDLKDFMSLIQKTMSSEWKPVRELLNKQSQPTTTSTPTP